MRVLSSRAQRTVIGSVVAVTASVASAAQLHWPLVTPVAPAPSTAAIQRAIEQVPALTTPSVFAPRLATAGSSANPFAATPFAGSDVGAQIDASTPALAAASASSNPQSPNLVANAITNLSPWGNIADEPVVGLVNPDGTPNAPIVPVPMPVYLAAAGLVGAGLLRRRFAR